MLALNLKRQYAEPRLPLAPSTHSFTRRAMKTVDVPKVLDVTVRYGFRTGVAAWIIRFVFYPDHTPYWVKR